MRILIVEDDQSIVNSLATGLKAECFSVDTATDGETGSYLARTNDYDTIILDYGLPKKNGLAVCKEIRNDNVSTPIMVLSVNTEIPEKIELINAGADDYLTKPFSFEELVARIHALIRRPREIVKDNLHIDGITINILRSEVLMNNVPVYLTRKEFSLLEYLVRNKNRVVTRNMILEHVWDMNADPFSNTVETHIRNLRKKLSDHDISGIIKTIPGRGYMASEN